MTSRLLATIARRALGAALGLGLAWSVLTPATASAEPAMWVVRDKDSTIYLFGTMHLTQADAITKAPVVGAALRNAEEMWLEVELPQDQAKLAAQLQPVIMQLGVDAARPLSSKLTPDENKRLAAALTRFGAPVTALEPLKPWLAGLQLLQLQLAQAGYDASKGGESVLTAAARTQNKPIQSFETAEQQLRFLAGQSEEVGLQSFRDLLEQLEEGPELLKQIETRWAAGDTDGLWSLLGQEMKAEQPQAYEALITARNKAWTDRLVKELKGSGTDFVAVGALHLVGPDSVQALLAQQGYTAVRVTNP